MEERVKKLAKLLCEWSHNEWDGKETSLLAQILDLFRREHPTEWETEWERHSGEDKE